MMSPDQIRLFIQHLDTMFNQPHTTVADEIFARHFNAYVPMMPVLNRLTFKNYLASFYTAFPDFHHQIHNSIIDGNWVVLRVTYSGTQQGDFLGIPATGCEVIMTGMSIFRIENGLIAECWIEMDIFSVVGQISSIASRHSRNIN